MKRGGWRVVWPLICEGEGTVGHGVPDLRMRTRRNHLNPQRDLAEFADAVFHVLPARRFFRDQQDGVALLADENFIVLKAELLG